MTLLGGLFHSLEDMNYQRVAPVEKRSSRDGACLPADARALRLSIHFDATGQGVKSYCEAHCRCRDYLPCVAEDRVPSLAQGVRPGHGGRFFPHSRDSIA